MSTEREFDRIEQQFGELLARHSKQGRSWHDYADRPVAFMKEALGFEPWSKQVEVIASVQENKRTVVRGHHAAGKDAILAALLLWATYARDMLCLVVSATQRQLLGQVWSEMAAMWRRQDDFAGDLFVGELRMGDDKRIVAMTSGSVSNLTGWHNSRGSGVLVAVSESQAEQVGNAAFDAAEGNAAAEGSRIVVVGNPIEPSGRFFEVHRRPAWHKVHISAFDHPNVQQGKVVIPGGPAPDWPADMAAEYGEDSPFYRARVLAEFPSEASDSLVTVAWLDRAVELFKSAALEHEARHAHYTVGVDPARLGPDRSVLCMRQGPVVRGFVEWRKLDTMTSADRIEGECRKILEGYSPHERGGCVERVVIDAIGIGAGIYDRLRDTLPRLKWMSYYGSDGRPRYQQRTIDVVSFNAASTAPDHERFANSRAQSYWHLRKLLEDGALALPDHEQLRGELLSTRVKFTSDGRVAVESKDDIKARIGRSPDYADALTISLAPLLRRSQRHLKPLVFRH